MHRPANHREPSNIIYLHSGALKRTTDAPSIRITSSIGRSSQILETMLVLVLIILVGASTWQCAQQSVVLSTTKGLQTFVEKSVSPGDTMTAGRKTVVPERS